VPFWHWSSESRVAVELNMISAHCIALASAPAHPSSSFNTEHCTYIIQRTPRMPQLNDLHTRHHPLQSLIPAPRVPSGHECFFQICLPSLFCAEDAGAGLVEHLDETDVEVCGVGTKGEIHSCEGGGVGAVENEGAAGGGPLCTCVALA
jgi:hypothetical protein